MMDAFPWLALLNVIAVDLMLSGDNAVVIGMAVRRQPPQLARRAAIIGCAGAVGLRVLFTAIAATLLAVPQAAATLLFTITSFTGQPFGTVANAFCRLVDARSGQEVARYDLGAQGPHTGLVMARIDRVARGWRMTAVGEAGRGRTWRELVGTSRSRAYPATRTP